MNQSSNRAILAIAGGLLWLGAGGTVRADHRSSAIDVTIATPGIYTRFATGPRYGYPPAYAYPPAGYYTWAPPPPVYVPGYWTYHPPRVHWQDDGYSHEHGPRHHRDRGRHEGWRRHKHKHHDD